MNLLKLIVWLPLIGAAGGSPNNSPHMHSQVRTMDMGGFTLTEGETVSPWLLKIMIGEEYACGASYISALFALTSASCLFPYRRKMNSLSVMYPTNNDDRRSRMTGHAKTRVTSIFVSKKWRWGDTYRDLAVVKLEDSLLDDSGRSKFAPLCSKPLREKDRLEVVACNETSVRDMQVESISVLNRRDCQSPYEDFVLRESVVCGKELVTTRKCLFHTGCPVSAGEELCGIVAWSPPTCKKRLPGVFTDIYAARHFITNIVNRDGNNLPERRTTTERPTMNDRPSMNERHTMNEVPMVNVMPLMNERHTMLLYPGINERPCLAYGCNLHRRIHYFNAFL